ncbi:hypothetical protein LLH06_10110 [Mucilaginibacter daejeonensis]|nr:hypothetical protein [Mucilaginibacter daejeonensis]UEG55313.1 hypothetical protein LLH06_10110 [Mucilaginibacter daejeonensis]
MMTLYAYEAKAMNAGTATRSGKENKEWKDRDGSDRTDHQGRPERI